MGSHRVVPLLAVALMPTFCVACAGRPAASLPPTETARAATTTGEAVELLRTADAFEDTRVGFGGELSRYVAAFRIVLADPGATGAFRGLVDHAMFVGCFYGAAGLYFAAPSAFDAALARITADGGTVATKHGCIGMVEPVAFVIRSGACDLAGGCIPLSLAMEGRAAP